MAAAVQESAASLTNNGYTLSSIRTSDAALRTPNGQLDYQLHEWTVSDAGAAGELYKGQAVGYGQNRDAYVLVQGNCREPEALKTLSSALAAVTFKP